MLMRVIYWAKNINTRRKNANDLLAVSNKVNAEKIRSMFMPSC
jgi:hypothetical protein